MSLTSDIKGISGVPRFNGDIDEFPIFATKFEALTYRLGDEYAEALLGEPPYSNLTYGSKIQVRDIPPTTDQSAHKTEEQDSATPVCSRVRSRSLNRAYLRSPLLTPSSERIRTYQQEIKTQTSQDPDVQQKYNKICRKIYGYLIGCLGTDPIRRIQNQKISPGDGIGAWRALKDEYQNGSAINTQAMVQKLTQTKMEGKLCTLSAYTYEFNRLITNLREQQVEMPEIVQIGLLLAGLTSEYKHIKNILNTSNELTFVEVCAQLRNFQEANGLDSAVQHNDDASGAGYVSRADNGRNHEDMVMECFNCKKRHRGGERVCTAPCGVCGKSDHIRYHCPQRKARRQETTQQKKQEKHSAGMATEDCEDSDDTTYGL